MTTFVPVPPPRWRNYVFDSGAQLQEFWAAHLAEQRRNLLFVLGKGFDPRMCLGLESILGLGGRGRRDVTAIEFTEGETSPSKIHAPLVEANWCKLRQLMEGTGILRTQTLSMWSQDGRRIGSRGAANIFRTLKDVEQYTDIIVDISALPRSIYFPLIARLMHIIDTSVSESITNPINLHVFVSEDPGRDQAIRDEGVDDHADYLHLFRSGLDLESTADRPRIWIPVLGEGQEVQFERIYDLVDPDEICPVLPSPSLNPRRADNLVLQYRTLLFESLQIEPRNFIYASERNPFEVYRQIRKAILHYQEALNPIGACKTALSALSTKLMSVGVLLVAYELRQAQLKVGVAHVDSQGYIMDEGAGLPRQSDLFGLWIAGECYEPL